MAARTDSVTDPALAAELLIARRGQAVWARALNDLPDTEFDSPSGRAGWSRAQLIAHIGFHARAIARLVEGARMGVDILMYDTPGQHTEEVEFGATLPVEALRNLAAHAAVHLNVEWRDLPEERWATPVTLDDGRRVPVRQTVALRGREVWLAAVDLGTGVGDRDLPVELRRGAAFNS